MFKHQDLQMFGLKLSTYISNFHPLEVGRGSLTQLQVGENVFFIYFIFIASALRSKVHSRPIIHAAAIY